MEASCPLGHSENLSHFEVARRLNDDDFDCREGGCSKELSYEVDSRFWAQYTKGAFILSEP